LVTGTASELITCRDKFVTDNLLSQFNEKDPSLSLQNHVTHDDGCAYTCQHIVYTLIGALHESTQQTTPVTDVSPFPPMRLLHPTFTVGSLASVISPFPAKKVW